MQAYALSFAALLLTLTACSPVFNWREVRPEDTALSLLLPCKPDRAEKKLSLGERPQVLRLLGCDAGGATFAVTVADVGDASSVTAVLAAWQSATLANMKASPPMRSGLTGATPDKADKADKNATGAVPLKVTGAASQPPAVLVKARGQRADGTAVSGQAAYFVQGSQVFQVVIYAVEISPEVAETFFSSLKFE